MKGLPASRRRHVRNLPPYASPARSPCALFDAEPFSAKIGHGGNPMETIFAILTVIVYILLALVGLVALTICVFLWMVSTRTRQDSKIFQERFDGWRKTRG